jgi:AcrR family transcriptional regulator
VKNSGAGVGPPRIRAYRGQSGEERVAWRRKRLIDVGIELYGTHGFRATSVKTVCLAAGLTERYFYESFDSGEDLLCETCTVIMDGMRQRAFEAMQQVGDSLPERVEVAANTYFSSLLERPAAGRITLFEMEGVSAAVDAYYAQELSKSTQLFVEWFLCSGKLDSRGALNAYILSQGMIGALYQIAKEWQRSNFRLPVNEIVHHMKVIAVSICAEFYRDANC